MRGGRGAWALAGALVAASGAAGCATRDDSSPEAAVRALIASARAGDRTAVYSLFGPDTRARIQALLGSSHRTGGARLLAPQDLVTVGWLPPAWEASGTRVASRTDAEAEVEVYSAAGERQMVHTVREGRSWKVELPRR
jgi:hypothetical protein